MALTAIDWYLLVATVLLLGGLVRLLLVRGRVTRLVAVNVMSGGSLAFLVTLAARSPSIDPVFSALVITGLVITVAFTGIGAVLIRRIQHTDGGDES